MISVVLCKVSQPSRLKRKSYDENFVTADCACSEEVDEYWRQVAAATNRFVYTREFLWKSLSLQQNFVVTTGGTNSVWFDYFATCCSDKILLWRQRFSQTFSRPHQAICRYDVTPQRVAESPDLHTRSDLSPRRIAATCGLVCSDFVREQHALKWSFKFNQYSEMQLI